MYNVFNKLIHNADGQAENWQERIMIPAMLKLIQEQKKEIDALNDRVTALENTIKTEQINSALQKKH